MNQVPPIVHDVLRSPGQPLAMTTRAFFEPRFGYDFSPVRIHTDSKAAESARGVNALAYTVGRNVVFGAGQYSPTTSAGRKLLAHELTHTVQQTSESAGLRRQFNISSAGDPHELEAERISNAVMHGASPLSVSQNASPTVVARAANPVEEATAKDRRETVDAAARWLGTMADQVGSMRRAAAIALETTEGSAAAPRAFHRYLNQEILGQLLNNTISVFKAQKSHSAQIEFPVESPEQTRLGEAYARAIEQLGLAMEEARVNASNMNRTIQETEERGYVRNHLRWLEANPSSPMNAGVRTTFTQTEVDLSERRYRQVTTEVADIAANLHRQDLSGDRAGRLRNALMDATYRLVRDQSSGKVDVRRDPVPGTNIQPVLDQLSGIEWAVAQAIDRLERAEKRTRAFAANTVANQTVGDTLQAHFSTRDPGYALLLADRLARLARELRGEGALTVHARNPQDTECGTGSVGGGISIVVAHADANTFHFCGDVRIGDEKTVSTVVHETVHAVIPSLGAKAPVTSSAETPHDRAYAYERIYSRLSTEEALDNAESYSFYVDSLLGVQVSRPSAPGDTVTGCEDADPVHDAIARATYRIRLGAMWADQTANRLDGAAPSQDVIDIIRNGFPGADAARAGEILTHLRNLAGSLEYHLPVVCRPATDPEARAGGLVYGPGNAATAEGLRKTRGAYPAGTLRICPAWFQAGAGVREDSLTSILVLRYRSKVPAADVAGFVRLARFIQESAHPSVAGRTLQGHKAADAPPTPPPVQSVPAVPTP